jgi:hypothetical protein
MYDLGGGWADTVKATKRDTITNDSRYRMITSPEQLLYMERPLILYTHRKENPPPDTDPAQGGYVSNSGKILHPQICVYVPIA